MIRGVFSHRNMSLLLVCLTSMIWLVGCTNSDTVKPINKEEFNEIKIENLDGAKEFLGWSTDRIPMVSAHRGGVYYKGYAENTIKMFEHVISHIPAIIEFDVRRSKDGALVVMHDSSTGRTTTKEGEIKDMTLEEIKSLRLIDYLGSEVQGEVPTLEEVLEWGRGKTLFTVDVKAVRDLDEVAEIIIDMGAEHYSVLITYSLDVAERLHEKYPSVLLSVTIRNEDELDRFLDTGIDPDMVIAFTGTSARDDSFNKSLHDLGIYTILGTMGNIDNSAKSRGDQVYRNLIVDGSDILSTDYPVEAYNAFKSLIPAESSKNIFFNYKSE